MMNTPTHTLQKVAFFGHPGSFTEQAALQFVQLSGLESITLPCHSIKEVFEIGRSGKGFFGVVPLQNTLSGDVAETAHHLKTTGVNEVRKIQVGIIQNLFANSIKSNSTEGHNVYSHPHALAQCRNFIAKAGLIPHSYFSTSTAARDLSQNMLPPGSFVIGHDGLGKKYQLHPVHKNITDTPCATTFLVFKGKG